ncbi:MAG: enoyl-CoA hydratase/isomerase family protein [Nostocoides sp.]
MAGTTVRLEVSDGTAWVTLDGPDTRNALDAAASQDLMAVCRTIDDDSTIGVAVLTGAGGAFCSGADTTVLAGLRDAAPHTAYEGLDELYRAFIRVGSLTVPTVAAVDGPAVGAGLNLALATDLRILTERALLVSGFARVGIHPGGGHLHLLARAGGAGLAASSGVFARPITAHEALTSGVAADVVSPERLHETVTRAVAHLAADPPLARALAATLRRTVLDNAVWDRAIEVERARQLWSLSRSRPQEA